MNIHEIEAKLNAAFGNDDWYIVATSPGWGFGADWSEDELDYRFSDDADTLEQALEALLTYADSLKCDSVLEISIGGASGIPWPKPDYEQLKNV